VIRVVLADDQTLVRQGIRGLLALAGDIEVIAEAATGDEAAALVDKLRPDVALFDVRMPGGTGIDALVKCRNAGFAPPTILLTTFDDDAAFRAGVEAGIAGWLMKDVSLEELAAAIRDVAAGKSCLRPVGARARESVCAHELDFDAAERPDPLTPREVEILRLIAAGLNNREIADALGVAEGTVKNHTSSILSKLGVRDRTRAVLKALERGDL
jgi:DNA-binding NarL/FixJ family response regulator